MHRPMLPPLVVLFSTALLLGSESGQRSSDAASPLRSADGSSAPDRAGVQDQAETQLTLCRGQIVDADTGQPIPARLHIQGAEGQWYFAQSDAPNGSAVHYRKQPPQTPRSVEMHTTLSAHPLQFELANNHMWQTRFGLTRWTREMVPEWTRIELDDQGGFTEWGWIDFGLKTYYALLDCGFRLRVTAGTASDVHPVQLGFGRVYVHLPEQFQYAAWVQGLDAGRSFVSTGPMLEVTFNERERNK